MTTHRTSGLAQIADVVDNNFNVKIYTQEMLNAINNPTANLALTIEAYQYFTAMVNGQDFTTSTGQKLDFSTLSDSAKKTLHDDACKVLADYGTIKVPYDAKGDAATLVDANGNPVSLLDLVQNPNAQFHVNFKVDSNDVQNGNDAPNWATKMDTDYNNEDNHWWGSANSCGQSDDFQVGDRSKSEIDAHVSQESCSNTLDWTLSGTATAWEAQGALNPQATNPNTTFDESNLENFLQQHM